MPIKKHNHKKSAQAEINPKHLIGMAGMFIILVIAMVGFSTIVASASVPYQSLVVTTQLGCKTKAGIKGCPSNAEERTSKTVR